MKYVISGASLYSKDGLIRADLLIDEGKLISITPDMPHISDAVYFQLNECVIFPGFVDVHVHLREPGFSYKETIESGTSAAARGGFTTVCAMPNLNPSPSSVARLQQQLDIIEKDAKVHVYPYGTITKNGKELSDMNDLPVFAFSDDGKGVQDDALMLKAMETAAALGKPIVAHCEDDRLLNGGYIHDGIYAKEHGHPGICSESEWGQVARDLELVRKTGCAYHVCHVSTKETVDLIRKAKAEHLNVSCETAPHYLILTENDLEEDGRFKMNPPLRTLEDRAALLQGIRDGTIDMIATDHAPHSPEEKSKGLEKSPMGVVGLETAFPILYTKLVCTGVISLEKLVSLLHDNQSRRFGLGTPLEIGSPADLTVFDLNAHYKIDPAEFLSKGKSTPFSGETVFGRCKLTLVDGIITWEEL
ncbi:MAG: dihydroorotase [Evtepia sp.]